MVAHFPVEIWLMANDECIGGPRVPTPQRCSADCSVRTGNAYWRSAAVKSNTTPHYDTRCSISVAMHISMHQQFLTTVSPKSNPKIVMLQEEAGFIRKHNAIPFRCPSPPFITTLAVQTPVFMSQGYTKPWT
ncbi:hypothetical protein TNCV_3546471 [Trichonephila clavipes]|nr:hypothetical protein TNCV_3546471 [Trichonephila clavipes]